VPNPVYLLVTSPDAQGGIARATATLANHLAETRPVEMICLYRRRRGYRFPLDPRVTLRSVHDEATRKERLLEHLPSETPGGDRTGSYNAMVDAVLPRMLQALEPGVIISTRAIFHLEIARHVPDHCVKIGQDHTNLQMREHLSAQQRELAAEADIDSDTETDVLTDVDMVGQAIGRLDRYVVLTEADAQSYRETFPEAADKLSVIRNPAPWPVATATGERQKVVVAAGKLGGRKGFDRLIEAYRPIAHQRPDWQLHIYGGGPQRQRLADLIEDNDLGEYVVLKGVTDQMQQVLEEAGIVALSSRFEGLPMVLIEAMTKGVPIVSVDCPNGPAEIVVDGVTGRLVPNDDMDAFTEALLAMMDDPEGRAKMGEQALKYAEQYQVDRVTQTWLDLFDSLEAARAETP
jgi:glycosyltransferase involved in cell wall biosynthesis